MNVVIKDNRDGKLYLDSEPAMLRLFETELETGITEDQAKRKYPGIIDVRKDTAPGEEKIVKIREQITRDVL